MSDSDRQRPEAADTANRRNEKTIANTVHYGGILLFNLYQYSKAMDRIPFFCNIDSFIAPVHIDTANLDLFLPARSEKIRFSAIPDS